MKKFILPLVTLLAMAVSCSSDDDSQGQEEPVEEPVEEPGDGLLRISQVDAVADLVTISNQGDSDLDVGDYFLCLGPGTYRTISGLTTESTIIAPDATLTVSYDVAEEVDGLSVFSTDDFGSSDPSILLDYVQWGEGGQARVDQAVTARRWDDATSVAPGVNVFTFNGGAEDVGSTFWTGEEEEEANGILRIVSVDAVADLVTISNQGDGDLDVGDYFLCLGPGTYRTISELTTESTVIAPDAELTVSYDVAEEADGLSVFLNNDFESIDPSILLDYVQWGEGGQARVGQAVTAGRWDSETSVAPGVNVFTFNGDAEDVGSTFWTGEEGNGILRILSVNPGAETVTLTNFGDGAIEIGEYFLCLGPTTYRRIDTLTTGDTSLEVNETLEITYTLLDGAAIAGLSVFSTGSFGSSDPEILVDFVQWGGDSQIRSDQAVTAGRWGSVDNFVPEAAMYEFTGGAEDVGVSFW